MVEIGGVAVTSPHRTCFDLMRGQPLVEMVVIADAFAWRGALNLPRLDAYVRPGTVGQECAAFASPSNWPADSRAPPVSRGCG